MLIKMVANFTDIFVWNEEARVSVLLLLSTFCFLIFWFVSESENTKLWFNKKYGEEKSSLYQFTFNKLLGLVTLGLIPFFFYVFTSEEGWDQTGFKFNSNFWPSYLFSVVAFSVFAIPLVRRHAQKPSVWKWYPQIRNKVWSRKTVFINVSGWAVYLLGYELFFRAILFFPLIEIMGVVPAIAVNVTLYSLSHVPKGAGEAVGAIPLGILFCFIVLYSGNIFTSFSIHLVIALTNSFTALKYNPELSWKNNELTGKDHYS